MTTPSETPTTPGKGVTSIDLFGGVPFAAVAEVVDDAAEVVAAYAYYREEAFGRTTERNRNELECLERLKKALWNIRDNLREQPNKHISKSVEDEKA